MRLRDRVRKRLDLTAARHPRLFDPKSGLMARLRRRRAHVAVLISTALTAGTIAMVATLFLAELPVLEAI